MVRPRKASVSIWSSTESQPLPYGTVMPGLGQNTRLSVRPVPERKERPARVLGSMPPPGGECKNFFHSPPLSVDKGIFQDEPVAGGEAVFIGFVWIHCQALAPSPEGPLRVLGVEDDLNPDPFWCALRGPGPCPVDSGGVGVNRVPACSPAAPALVDQADSDGAWPVVRIEIQSALQPCSAEDAEVDLVCVSVGEQNLSR